MNGLDEAAAAALANFKTPSFTERLARSFGVNNARFAVLQRDNDVITPATNPATMTSLPLLL